MEETVIQVALPPELTDEDLEMAVMYRQPNNILTPEQNARAWRVYDVMALGIVTLEGHTMTFRDFYRRHIDEPHADAFLTALLEADAPESNGFFVLRDTTRRILADLRQMGLRFEGNAPHQCLVAYCAYWWTSFGRGYIREVAVFQDLAASGIAFTCHDLRDRAQRFSPHDLAVLGFTGDIKTNTYFLQVARIYPLASQFYLVRLYDTANRMWLDIALMKPEMWKRLDGETTATPMDRIIEVLRVPVQIETRGEALVVIMYGEWKRRVLRVQAEEKQK